MTRWILISAMVLIGLADVQVEAAPDDIYVLKTDGDIHRYDGQTGDFIGLVGTGFDDGGSNKGIQFGPGGDLYTQQNERINKFDLATGTETLGFVDVVGATTVPTGFAFEPIPEPATLGLLLVGGLIVVRRRQF